LIYWALRRDDLCEPGLCPDAPDDGARCDHCPLDKLEAAQNTTLGILLKRALDLNAAIKLGFHLTLEDVRADEFGALVLLAQERDKLEQEQAQSQ
jgi:hypothetical protein